MVAQVGILLVALARGGEYATPVIETSNSKLAAAFRWSTGKALSYVQTGRTGVVDRHEGDKAGAGPVPYMPCYWAGYTFRTAFYSRDYCHQAAGAQLLGLHRENLAMLRAFAASATAGRKWYPLWALNFDGSPFKLDFQGDHSFVREVPAVFELVEQCWRQYQWTGDETYIRSPVLTNFCAKAVTEFIRLHDSRIPNGVAEGDGSGDIFRGSATYNENRSPLVEAGDGMACQYQAFLAYSGILGARGEHEAARSYATKAEQLRSFFNSQWGVKKGEEHFVRGYDTRGEALTDFGKENSWFLPMKFITDPSPRTDAYLGFIARSVEDPRQRPPNLEAISYLPGVFFPYHRVEDGWRWLEYLIDAPDREYPEISYTILSHVVEGLLGFEPDAPGRTFHTMAHLPGAIPEVGVRGIPMGDHRIDVTHRGMRESVVTHVSGSGPLKWQAYFHGSHSEILVNGERRLAEPRSVHGVRSSRVVLELPPGRSITATVP
ncbi:MAG: hypothetical protein JNK85_06865 [Verrucomicrobiales bacterium]|nr:hypothetical protein [Verrucomicrobiales bacterium]